MSLLEDDADELKKSAQAKAKGGETGRKVNQSGLGAFKGLGKYNNLTAKYRAATQTSSEPESATKSVEKLTVEHQRGTSQTTLDVALSKSVQSPGEVSATSLLEEVLTANFPSPTLTSGPQEKVGAKSGRSPGEVSAKSVQDVSISDVDLPTKLDIQSSAEELTILEVSAKSVQTDISPPSNSVQSRGEVSAKLENEFAVEQSNPKSVQSPGIVSAKSVHNFESAQPSSTSSAKSKHSYELDLLSHKMGSKSVQSPGKVSADRIQDEVNGDAQKFLPEVGAKSVHHDLVDSEIAPYLEIQNSWSKSNPDPDNHPKSLNDLNINQNQQPELTIDFSSLQVSVNNEILTSESDFARFQQSQGELSAKSVQSQSLVSAKAKFRDKLIFRSPGKVRSIVSAEVRSKLVQSPGKLEPLEAVTSLSGAQRITLEFLFERCHWENTLITPPITKQQLVAGTQLLEETALSAIKRLRAKQIIDRSNYKDGKAGWTQYEIAEQSYRELLQLNHLGAKSVQSPSKVSSKVSSEVSAGPTSSSSSSFKEEILKTTTADQKESLPSDWLKIDISELAEIGMGATQLRQIHSLGILSSEQTQLSINHFAFALKKGKHPKFSTGPLNYFMGIIRKGPYVVSDYVSAFDEALEKLTAQKLKEVQARAERERSLCDAYASEWLAGLSTEEQQALARKVNCLFSQNSPGWMSTLKLHYQEGIWPEVYRGLVQGIAKVTDPGVVAEVQSEMDKQFGPRAPDSSVSH